MNKVTFSRSLIATKSLERSIDEDLFDVTQRFGADDDEIISKVTTMQHVIEDVMGSLRHKLLRLEHEINTLNEKREETNERPE